MTPGVAFVAASAALLFVAWVVLGALLGRAVRNIPVLAGMPDAGAPRSEASRLPSL